MTALLNIQGLSKIFGDIPVVDRIDLQVTQGEIVMVIGPSGAGKSTLLRCVNRIETPTEGNILLDGVNMAGETRNGKFVPDAPTVTARKRRRIGMVFQRFNLFAHLTALDNVAIGPRRVLGLKSADARKLAAEQLARVRLSMLFDEPTSALDPELVGEVLEVIRSLADEGMTMLVVTHEMQFARDVGTRVLFMDSGRVLEDEAPKLFFSDPRHTRAKEFLRRIHMVPAE